MTNIQVPLGQSLTKFPNIKMAKPEFTKRTEDKAGSDIEFFKILADRGRMVFSTDNTQASTGSFAAIIPNNGETFYFIGGAWELAAEIDSAATIELRNDGISRESVSVLTDLVAREERGAWQLKFDSLIGDGSKTYDILMTETTNPVVASANIYGYILPSETLSSRGSGA